MNGCQHLDGLELDDESIGDPEVEAALTNTLCLVPDRDGNLATVWEISLFELDAQRAFVHRLEEARSENRVDLYRRSDDLGGIPVEFRIGFPMFLGVPGVLALHLSRYRVSCREVAA